MKSCSKCKLEQPLDQYVKNKHSADRLSYSCKACRSKLKKANYAKNRQRDIAYSLRWAKANRDRIIAARKNRPPSPSSLKEYKRVHQKDNSSLTALITEHKCNKCLNVKPVNQFSSSKTCTYGIKNRCKACDKIVRRTNYLKNQKKSQLYSINYIKNNSEKVRQYRKTYKPCQATRNAINRKRDAQKINATPKWLTKEHLSEMKLMYKMAEELRWLNNGEPLHVDHIIPLKGKNSSGLHVPWNLQIIPASWNIKKNNKHDLLRIDNKGSTNAQEANVSCAG